MDSQFHHHHEHEHHQHHHHPQQHQSQHTSFAASAAHPDNTMEQHSSRKRSVSQYEEHGHDLEERTWNSFKRMRLHASDESSPNNSSHSGSADEACFNSQRGMTNQGGGGGVAHHSLHHHHPQHHQQQQQSYDNFLQQQQQQHQHQHHYPNQQNQQHPGQVTSSHAECLEEDYTQVNHLLGFLHQQRKQRSERHHHETAPATATSESEGARFRGHFQTNAPYHQAGVNPPPSGAAPRQKPPRRHAVRLPSDSKLL